MRTWRLRCRRSRFALLGPATAGFGAIACVSVIGGVSAWGGGEPGKIPGEYIGEILYERNFMIEIGLLEIALLTSMLPLPFILLWVVVVAIITLERLEGTFSESVLIKHNKDMLQGLGLPGKVIRCGAIFMMCIRPEWHESKGLLRRCELNGLTRRMKLTLYPPFIALSVFTIAAVVCAVVLKIQQS